MMRCRGVIVTIAHYTKATRKQIAWGSLGSATANGIESPGWMMTLPCITSHPPRPQSSAARRFPTQRHSPTRDFQGNLDEPNGVGSVTGGRNTPVQRSVKQRQTSRSPGQLILARTNRGVRSQGKSLQYRRLRSRCPLPPFRKVSCSGLGRFRYMKPARLEP